MANDEMFRLIKLTQEQMGASEEVTPMPPARATLWIKATKQTKPHIIRSASRSCVTSGCGTFTEWARQGELEWQLAPPVEACKLCVRLEPKLLAAHWAQMVLIGRRFGVHHPQTPEVAEIVKAGASRAAKAAELAAMKELEAELNRLDTAREEGFLLPETAGRWDWIYEHDPIVLAVKVSIGAAFLFVLLAALVA